MLELPRETKCGARHVSELEQPNPQSMLVELELFCEIERIELPVGYGGWYGNNDSLNEWKQRRSSRRSFWTGVRERGSDGNVWVLITYQ